MNVLGMEMGECVSVIVGVGSSGRVRSKCERMRREAQNDLSKGCER